MKHHAAQLEKTTIENLTRFELGRVHDSTFREKEGVCRLLYQHDWYPQTRLKGKLRSSYVTARRKLRKSGTLRTQPFSRVLAIRLAVGAGSGSEQRPPSRKPKQPRRINKWNIRVRKLGLSGPNTQSGLTRKRLHTRSSTLML